MPREESTNLVGGAIRRRNSLLSTLRLSERATVKRENEKLKRLR
jgi:hypothetical protein